MKKVAIFDIDGTIFRSSLIVELTDALIQEGIFSSKVRRFYRKAHKKWLDRKGPYGEYIDAVVIAFRKNIKGVGYKEFSKVAKKVVAFHQNRIYRYTRDLIKRIKRQNYYLLAISHSPKKIVEEFCEKLGFNKVYGQIYEINKKKIFTGKVLFWDLIIDKSRVLKRAIEKERLTLKDSIGVGDTESDISFLKMVENPICFNPNKKLYLYAKKASWKIIVERKDVIYNI